MSYIPNCRPRLEKDAAPFPHKKTESISPNAINPYWYGLLRGRDAEFLRGFDWNTSEAVNNFFNNLDVFEDELAEVGIDIEDINTSIVNGSNNDQCKWYSDYSEEELSQMSNSTKIMLLFKSILNQYIENERNELATTMIESMDKIDYNAALAEEELNSQLPNT